MAIDDHDGNCLQEDESLSEDRINGGNGAEALTRVELDVAYSSEKLLNLEMLLMQVADDVAYSSEKLLNLEMLLMQVADRAHDIETVNMGYEDISDESVMKAFESDILSGILDMEVNELQSFMSLLQIEIMEACQNFCQGEPMEDCAATVEEKLHDAEESVKKLQDRVADIREQSSKFERTLALFHNETRSDENEELEIDLLTSIKKPQTVDQQRHVLQMLEKSLARELDLEKKLSEYRSNEEDLKIKLHHTERELYCMEELMEICLERTFEAENSAELHRGISRELAGKLQLVQLNLKSSLHREHDMRFKLEENMMQLHAEEAARERLTSSHSEFNDMLSSKEKGLKASVMEAEEKGILVSAEILSLREKVMALEERLRESNVQLQTAQTSAETSQQQQSALQSDLFQMENVMEGLKANVLRAESKAESAEAKYTELSKSNIALNEENVFLRNNESEKRSLLERRHKESNTQLEHAKASVEALEEQQNVLYAAITDMQSMIEDLKAKVSKAESRAENAESKCTLLTETNLELNEELGCLRERLEYLETSLHQTEGAKIATAKDIGIRTKIISDLVMKLALEREHLQLQISALTKKNKVLLGKCKRKDNAHVP
ncbi:WPP domain-interacting tail-anchored protein [Musa troglodytarum]|uniref:WPP domain-interacting tail-anchored protein n=1 Tax=Musa troglodytarum TaxID=320322 RepID=A0A9E7GLV6_9LILI|nr:WPP domain-interacting tail-anchored protein [Musa troglodytarum]URE14409.1 WPP domain-interacting tail-anchored protein [Musa troglodytarum]